MKSAAPTHVDVALIIREMLDAAGIEYADVTVGELAGQTVYSISGVPSQHAHGHSHADLVHAIDLLIKKLAERRTSTDDGSDTAATPPSFLVDVNEYRTKHIKDLQTRALMMAERARSFQYDVELSPMSAYERLIVHATLAQSPNVTTESRGEGTGRRVVIKYAA